MSRRSAGNGDICPLVAEHGQMLVMPNSHPPVQYCSHVMHDGSGPRSEGGDPIPRSRAIWPVYGLEETVETYFARIYRAIGQAAADGIDLSGLEVI